MPELTFAVSGARPVESPIAPLVALEVRIENRVRTERVRAISLRCQVRIEPGERRYGPGEQAGLRDLFGEPGRYGETMKSMLWAHATATAQPFEGETRVELPVPCSIDLEAATARYFRGVSEGEVPLTLLFSGTVFYEDGGGALQVAPVPWTSQASFRLPVEVHRRALAPLLEGGVVLRLRADVFDRLAGFRTAAGLPTWEATLERLLAAAGES